MGNKHVLSKEKSRWMSLVEDASVAARRPSDSWMKGAPAATRRTTVVTSTMLATCERKSVDETGL